MSAIKERMSIEFKENTYKFLKIHSIGYNDFSLTETSDFYGANIWHALYYVKSGNGTITSRGKTYPLKAGSLYFITPNEPIRYCSDKDDPLTYFWIAFYPEFAEEIMDILGFTKEEPVHMAKAPQKVEWIFTSLFEKKSTSSELYFSSLSSLMKILSTEFSKKDAPKSTLRDQALVENIKRHIELNYTNSNFTINTVAQMLYMSHPQMTRVFKEMTGTTPVSYLIEVRLSHAAKLLQAKNYTVKELCEAVGFSDEWHFMKTFKKKFDMTVKEYRAQFIQK